MSDISRAIELPLDKDVPGGTVLHVASGRRDQGGRPGPPVLRRRRRPGPPGRVPADPAGEVDRNFASYDRAEQVLGYAPAVTLEAGIGDTWDWFQEHVFRA